jgi:serine/threonine-protein kinase
MLPSTSPLDDSQEKLGRYQLKRLIGVGGMAEVYLALDTGGLGLDRWVAIKRIRADLVREGRFTEMLLDEARLAARISHPNVAQVIDLGHDGAAPYIAMEYIKGRPLSETLERAEQKGDPLDLDLACRIVAHACEGAHAAHELLDSEGRRLGLVHRDLSPHNIMITFDGNVKVLDFGIAKAAGRSADTLPGLRKGKVSYMSPEQIRGEELDRRTDVYTLGLVLYEATTTKSAFAGVDAVARLKETFVEPPSALAPDYPPELESIVLRALDPARERRFETAREMSRALERFVVDRRAITGPAELAATMARLFPHSTDVPSSPPQHAVVVPALPELRAEIAPRLVARGSSTKTRVRGEPTRRASWPRVLGIAAILFTLSGATVWTFRPHPAIKAPDVVPPPPEINPTTTAAPDHESVPEPATPVDRRVEKKRPPKVRQRKMGTIDVRSTPWSNVFLDGTLVQATPVVGLPVEAGAHELKLVTSDGRVKKARVKIVPTQATSVDVAF